MPRKNTILDALSAIIDPDFQQDIVSLGFVTGLEIQDGKVSVELELTSPECSAKNWFKTQAERHIRRVPGVTGVQVTMTARQDPDPGSTCPHATGGEAMPALSITAQALEAIEKLELPDGGFLRISVVPGGCSGHTYSAAVDDEMFVADRVLYESGRLRIVTDPDSAEYLDGLEIDYSDDLIRSGFRFSNPNASGSCGCGASFEA
jgi:iron-sulfur cluster assembly protein